MSEQKSFFTTLPGVFTGLAAVITAVAGLIYALHETGIMPSRETNATQLTAVQPAQPVTVTPKGSAPIASKDPVPVSRGTSVAQKTPVNPKTDRAVKTPVVVAKTPEKETADGWAIIGYYQQGRFSDLKLIVGSDSPAIGRSYDAVEDFRLILKRPETGEAVITLGMVHRGERVEVLDIAVAPGTSRVPVWAKLRAVLHSTQAPR